MKVYNKFWSGIVINVSVNIVLWNKFSIIMQRTIHCIIKIIEYWKQLIFSSRSLFSWNIFLNQTSSCPLSYKASPTELEGYPFYQVIFHMHSNSRILSNCPSQERTPLLTIQIYHYEKLLVDEIMLFYE